MAPAIDRELTQAKVRRERLGHIELASPCSHVWFFKGLPSRIGHLLDIPLRELEKVLYFENYIVIADKEDIDSLGLSLKEREMVTDERYRQLKQEFPGKFTDEVCKMGAEAIKTLLQKVDVDDLADVVVFVVDAMVGATDTDEAVVRLLRRSGKPVVLVANKVDDQRFEADASSLWNLGLGQPWPVSSLHGRGSGDMLDAILEVLPRVSAVKPSTNVAARRSATVRRCCARPWYACTATISVSPRRSQIATASSW